MPQFFIDRPVFAWVLAILITLGGALTVFNLPVESYPSIAPPQININTTYPGADAQTIESSVTQPIEQQLVGMLALGDIATKVNDAIAGDALERISEPSVPDRSSQSAAAGPAGGGTGANTPPRRR